MKIILVLIIYILAIFALYELAIHIVDSTNYQLNKNYRKSDTIKYIIIYDRSKIDTVFIQKSGEHNCSHIDSIPISNIVKCITLYNKKGVDTVCLKGGTSIDIGYGNDSILSVDQIGHVKTKSITHKR